ncbi:16S rRNA (cytidine(1402)-2'-O)-methyltransferase [Pseudactinotalea sp. HY158]|uniref:16S rRNA (cytidine(1402)-2'-O)-methyltransferase n=1 Tax=Pseudactinotalea sp. HY158 TaxID=2654547 RepID=UPI001E55EA47|nr:16S rRNA (cytidine(1402)-2'-O)-methyltransferase [Pseudactinotalea sp. HY158]
MPPILLAGTPIGSTEDASPRLRRALAGADLIAAEDTRRLRALLGRLELRTGARVIAYHEHNEQARTPDLVDAARRGQRVVMVSDAGMPGISDPGFRLVEAAAAGGVPVSVVPGPSAVLTALAVSGLPTDRFCFEGFAPRKPAARRGAFAELATERRTIVFFESPHRIAACLADLARAFGADRRAAVCRELTKTHEEVRRGTLAELADWAADGLRGEIAVVVAGATPTVPGLEELVARVRERIAAGARMREAVDAVAAEAGASRRELYEATLADR